MSLTLVLGVGVEEYTRPCWLEVQHKTLSQENKMERDKTGYPMPLASTHTQPHIHMCPNLLGTHNERKKGGRKGGKEEKRKEGKLDL